MGEFGQDAGVTPLLFFEGHPGIFKDHRESGPLGPEEGGGGNPNNFIGEIPIIFIGLSKTSTCRE